MSNLDERMRQLVRTIGDAAPDAPPLHDAPQTIGHRGRVPGPIVAVASFATVLVVFIGLQLLLGGNKSETPPATAAGGSVEVRHQVVNFQLEAELSCEHPTAAGASSVTLETWADLPGGRHRQHATYPDGSTRDLIVLGDLNAPTQVFGMGSPQLPAPRCGANLLGDDPTSGPQIVFFNAPADSPAADSYKELGFTVPGTHTDSLGRSAVLYRQTIDGTGLSAGGTEFAIHQVNEWYVDPGNGAVLEAVTVQTGEGQYNVRQTLTMVSDDSAAVDDAIFDPDGYQLEWESDDPPAPQVDGTPVKPSLTLGTDVVWPQPLDPDGPESVAFRFASEVLGWDSPLITLDPAAAGNVPTWVGVNNGLGQELTMLAAPDDGGAWGLLQVGNPPDIGTEPGGGVAITLATVAGASRLTIHVATREGTVLAWEADLTDQPKAIVLYDIRIGEVSTLVVTYRNAAGDALGVDGGQYESR